jgi:hypothetical protein
MNLIICNLSIIYTNMKKCAEDDTLRRALGDARNKGGGDRLGMSAWAICRHRTFAARALAHALLALAAGYKKKTESDHETNVS